MSLTTLLPSTFAALPTIGRIYRSRDEALRDSITDSRLMLNDLAVIEPLEQRISRIIDRAWVVRSPDRELEDKITDLISRIPRFAQYLRHLAFAVWYGRSAVAQDWQTDGGVTYVSDWKPIHPDKLLFRAPDGAIGLRMSTWSGVTTEPADFGQAYFLPPEERHLLALHTYHMSDAPYEDVTNAAAWFGVGLRSQIYNHWQLLMRIRSYFTEFLARSSTGIELWHYPAGNPEMLERTREVATQRYGEFRNVVLVPAVNGEPQVHLERIQPDNHGAEVMREYILDLEAAIRRMILGQTLTSMAEATGLGSGVAEAHERTIETIARDDARALAESITTELVIPLVRANFPAAKTPVRVIFV